MLFWSVITISLIYHYIAINYITILSLYHYYHYHITIIITMIHFMHLTLHSRKKLRLSVQKNAISSGGSFRLLGSPRRRYRWTLELDTPGWVEHRRCAWGFHTWPVLPHGRMGCTPKQPRNVQILGAHWEGFVGFVRNCKLWQLNFLVAIRRYVRTIVWRHGVTGSQVGSPKCILLPMKTHDQPRAFSLHPWWEPWLARQGSPCGRLMGCPLNQWI